MLPTLTGTGRLTFDPELKVSQSGVPVCTLSLAFNSRKLNKQTNQWEDGDTYFVRAIAFHQLAENIAETLQRGMEVNVTGTVRTERWEKDGVKHEMSKLVLDSIGPNLAYATAQVRKAERVGGPLGDRGTDRTPSQNGRQQPAQQRNDGWGGAQQQRPPQGQQQPQDDPWSVPASSDEPPF